MFSSNLESLVSIPEKSKDNKSLERLLPETTVGNVFSQNPKMTARNVNVFYDRKQVINDVYANVQCGDQSVSEHCNNNDQCRTTGNIPDCNNDSDCQDNKICKLGICVLEEKKDECTVNSNCLINEVCEGGKCVTEIVPLMRIVVLMKNVKMLSVLEI